MDSIAIINEGNAPFFSEFLIMIPEQNRNGQVLKEKLLYRKQFNGRSYRISKKPERKNLSFAFGKFMVYFNLRKWQNWYAYVDKNLLFNLIKDLAVKFTDEEF